MEIRQLRADEFEERMALSQFAFQYELTPEEKLLKAIFGEKAEEKKDSSLYLEPGKEVRNKTGARSMSRAICCRPS